MSTRDEQAAALYQRIFGDTHALEQAIHNDPRFLQAMKSGTPTRFRIVVPGARNDPRMNNSDGGWDVRVDADGKVSASNGGIWKPIAVGAGVAAGGFAAAGAIPGVPGIGSGAGGTPTIAGTSYGNGMAATAPSIAGATGVPAADAAGGASLTSLTGAPIVAAKAAPEAGMGWLDDVAAPDGGDVVGGVMPTSPTGPSFTSLLKKYAVPAAGKAIDAVLQNRRANQEAQAARTRAAVDESKLDPFRGYMAQSGDVSRLNWMADQNYTPPATQLDPKYGAGLNLPAPRNYGPSPQTTDVLHGAADQIAAGDTAPMITPGAKPLPVLRLLRRRPAQPVSQSWLA